MKRTLAEAIYELNIRISNKKMNRILAENGINFSDVKHIKSVKLERKAIPKQLQ
jgi:hypothetical protein